MTNPANLIFEYIDMKLAPSDAFSAFHSSLPPQCRSHTAIIRLGILTHQLHEYEYDLNIETESGQSSFGEFDFTSQREFETVQEFADKIEASLNSGGPLIINRNQFSSGVYTAVEDFLDTIEEELSDERERLVRNYCKKCGLSAARKPEPKEPNETMTTRTPSSSQSGRNIKTDLIDVSKY